MGGEDLHVPMANVWSLSSTQSDQKTAKSSGRFPEIEWLLSHNVYRQYTNATSGQWPTTTSDPNNLPIIQELEVNGVPEEICTDAHSGAWAFICAQ